VEREDAIDAIAPDSTPFYFTRSYATRAMRDWKEAQPQLCLIIAAKGAEPRPRSRHASAAVGVYVIGGRVEDSSAAPMPYADTGDAEVGNVRSVAISSHDPSRPRRTTCPVPVANDAGW
jgi:hypothetical protein